MKITELIVEGGNVWRGNLATVRITREQVKPTVTFLEQITGLPLLNNMLGSTGIKEDSSDIDLGVDAKSCTKDQLVSKLRAWAEVNDPSALVKKTGISVHFRCPISGKNFLPYCQVDFMFVPDLKFTSWTMKTHPTSEYKNHARIILIASLAKAHNLRFEATTGLKNRETGEPISKGTNPDYIAKLLLNPRATKNDLVSVESILAALKNDPQRDEKLKDARQTLPMYGVPPEVMK